MIRVLVILIVLLFPFASSSQQSGGLIDLEDEVRAQIETLRERWRSGLDQPAHQQVVLLQWLIELYSYVDELDHVEACYQQILAYFPYDVGTMNAYALFMIERRNDYERAEKQLLNAAEWGKNTDARALDLGTTFQLLARVELARGDHETAITHAQAALFLLSEENSADALRLLAEGYLLSEAYDAAADAYIKLITLERALNREDVNALQLFLHKTTGYGSGSVKQIIADAIAEHQALTRTRIQSEGGEVISCLSEDGVALEGTFRRAEGPGAVIFVTDLGGNRSVFAPYAQLLFIDKISTLSLDLRGHGGSRADSLPSFTELSPAHASRLTDDVVAGFRFIQKETGLDESQIMIVAAGRGCALVEKALHQASLTSPVLYLSPYFQSRDLALKNAISFHPELPTLVVFSAEDMRATQSLEIFKDIKELSSLTVKRLEDAGHGVDMLRRDVKALEFFQDWVGKNLGVR